MTEEEGGDLAVKKIAQRIRGDVSAERSKVTEAGHLYKLGSAVAESDRLDEIRRTRRSWWSFRT
jgi:hypothetical protein